MLCQRDEDQAKETGSRFNLALKTTGGTQLWTDHCYREGFRIQQNALTGHWRLLDSEDVRQAWGTRAQCVSALDELQPKNAVAQSPQHVVVLLHGLMRTHHSMKPLETALAAEGYPDVIRFSYASTRCSIGDHATALREVLEEQPGKHSVQFCRSQHGQHCGEVPDWRPTTRRGSARFASSLQIDGDARTAEPGCCDRPPISPQRLVRNHHGAREAWNSAPSGTSL